MNYHRSGLLPVRISRSSFFKRGALLLCGTLTDGLLFNAAAHASVVGKIVFIGVGAALAIMLCVALFCSILIPRVRDLGLHPAWSLLILVRGLDFFFILALLFIPSDAFAKKPHWTDSY